jgi:Tfp pilus assembly protein PilX
MRQRLNNESGIALVMAIGILSVLMIAGSSVVYYAGSNARSAEYSGDDTKAVNLGEAGMNYARAILWNSTTPTSASAVPSCTPSPPQLTMEGGTVTYCGTYDAVTQTWTLIGTGNYTNPTAGTAPISRTVSSQVQVTTSSSFDPAWGYLFSATTTVCTSMKNNITIDAPVYLRGNLCMENSATIMSELVRVRGTVDIKDMASIGTAADVVDRVEVRLGCRYPWSGSYVTPCGTSQKVYRTTFSSTPPNITKPTLDLNSWFLNAKPGPKAGCTTGSFPGTFDNSAASSTLPNRSNPTQYLFPTTAYDCQVKDGSGNLLGRIAYTPGNPGTFIIHGVVFFDGKLELQGNRNVVYQGRGSIYASDEIKMQSFVTLCGIAGCSSSWNPNSNLLAFVGGAIVDNGVLLENNTTFQGAIYVRNDYLQKNFVHMCGPVIARELKIENGSQNCYVPFSSLAPGMPGSSGAPSYTLTNVPDTYTTD